MVNNNLSHLPASMETIATERYENVFDENEHELTTNYLEPKPGQDLEKRPIVKVLVLSDCERALEKVYDIICRDMRTHILCCKKGTGCVCAHIYAMKDFTAMDSMVFYYAHLYRCTCPKTQIWVSEEGGMV